MPSPLRSLGIAAGTLAALGTAVVASAVAQTRQFTTRHEVLPVLPAGSEPIRILHLSDIHFVPGQDKKLAWLLSLAQCSPDLIVNTGDNLSHQGAVPALVRTLGSLPSTPGLYVPGSNDYYAPRLKNPLEYLVSPSTAHPEPSVLPWRELFSAFDAFGWTSVTNARASMSIKGTRLDFAGVDDPHLGFDEYPGFEPGATGLRIGITHAPYLRVLDAMAEDGARLIIAGHTHGGQVCLPGGRAIVSNCDLPPELARGMNTWSSGGQEAFLNVSAGIGTSRFAPVRLFCPPEAVVIDLVEGVG